MPDRSLRLLPLPPQTPPQEGQRGGLALPGRGPAPSDGHALLRERPASPPDASSPIGSGNGTGGGRHGEGRDGGGHSGGGDSGGGDEGGGSRDDGNPFAPPPEGTPDRPWQPRRPAGGKDDDSDSPGDGGYVPWGSQWSDRQPGRSAGGGFGERPGAPGGHGGPAGQGGQGGQGGPEGPGGPSGPGMRWDPTDPVQRRARYSLLCGMWAFFFILFGWPYVALLLGALAVYWSISSLRGTSRRAPDPDTGPARDSRSRPPTTAAISGLVTASLALVLVAATFATHLVYRDYYTCTNDALTHQARQSCSDLLPKELRNFLGNNA
ncbi:hypothetical protein [Streptomyces sp. NPDC047000]|uniref:hypothetical protein n=1 Tax=Streptomyces sp. NPDC047000 TaxID=3155474 RepID=UPI00340B34BA